MSASHAEWGQSSNAIPKASWWLCLGPNSKECQWRTGQQRHGVDVRPNYVLLVEMGGGKCNWWEWYVSDGGGKTETINTQISSGSS